MMKRYCLKYPKKWSVISTITQNCAFLISYSEKKIDLANWSTRLSKIAYIAKNMEFQVLFQENS